MAANKSEAEFPPDWGLSRATVATRESCGNEYDFGILGTKTNLTSSQQQHVQFDDHFGHETTQAMASTPSVHTHTFLILDNTQRDEALDLTQDLMGPEDAVHAEPDQRHWQSQISTALLTRI